jgi:hypothetical protein
MMLGPAAAPDEEQGAPHGRVGGVHGSMTMRPWAPAATI